MTLERKIANLFRMDEKARRRHSNSLEWLFALFYDSAYRFGILEQGLA